MFGSGYVEDELNKEILQLKDIIDMQDQTINKMRCCGNCKYDILPNSSENKKCCICTTKNYMWELKEV